MTKFINISTIGQGIVVVGIMAVIIALSSAVGYAGDNSEATDWDNFLPPTGYSVPYTFNGQPVQDHEGSGSNHP